MKPVALTIAGSDPSGGAGLQADLKTFHQFGVYGMSVVTLLTVQNTQRVDAVEPLSPDLVRRQLEAVLEDIPPQAAKTGALGTAGVIEAVADCAARFWFPLVVDPVMVSKHAAPLIAPQARETLVKLLLPRAFLVTPNLHEAAALAGFPVADPESMERAARAIAALGPRAVLVKGGHLPGEALDVLYFESRARRFTAPRLDSRHTHGTGCTFSAAITAQLARGSDLAAAVETAKRFITRAIQSSPGLGRGCGPVDHHAAYNEIAAPRRDTEPRP
jgi:hydroxymethylpyrimidine/phosphomethylpyrimidine kinase